MARFFISCVVVGILSGSQLLYPVGWAMASDKPMASSPQPSSAISQKADKELATLRQNPEEFRALVTGVQIFLGRFGYGLGPYTGQLDQATRDALKAYQKKTGLSETGDINFHTLKRLTEDDSVLSRIVPFLPAQVSRVEEWDKWVEVQGSWMLKEGNTDDVLRTSRISCMREFQRCIDSTASLVNANVPQLKVHTHVYDIKEWDDDKIVSFPYDGEACSLSILRISRKPTLTTRFVTLQGKPGMCAKVKAEDRQYLLKDGQEIYQSLKMQKAKAIQQILQVAQ
ncbi:MAG: peptidoglycan-binding protein [Nitrospirota bacterium]|nr:MAG: peptidoglycan-binding protein [Nitrospirota bacterium]